MRPAERGSFSAGQPLSARQSEATEIEALRSALAEREAALRESRRQFSSLLESISGTFYRCEVRPPWRVASIGQSVHALTGYRAEHFEQMEAWLAIMHPEDVDDVAAEVAAAVSERRPFSLVYRIRHRGGGERWVHERGQAVHAEAGDPVFLEGVISDISPQKALERSLHDSVQGEQRLANRWRSTLDAIPQMVWTVGADGRNGYNRRWLEFTGLVEGPDPDGRLALVHPDDRERARTAWAASLASGTFYECEYRLRHHSGEYRWIVSRGEPEKDNEGRILGWYGTCTDFHERAIARHALAQSELRARGILDSVPGIIWCADPAGEIDYVSPQWKKGFALPPTGEAGDSWTSVIHPDDLKAALREWQDCVRNGDPYETSFRVMDAQGSYAWTLVRARPSRDAQGRITRWFGTCTDIHQQVLAEERARWSANHDALTGLPNRLLLQDRIDEEIERARTEESGFALLLLDLDHFKRLNDTVGHDAGDALLMSFAARLRAAVGRNGTAARLGGDEFAVIISGVTNADELRGQADAILAATRTPCDIGGRLVDCNASIGATLFPRDAETRNQLMKNADIALYAAKKSGRNTLRLFESELRNAFQRRTAMLNVARDAIQADRILPYYQPIVDLRSGATVGFEALLRWRDISGEIQLPDTIGSAFDDARLAVAISDQMIDLVIADLQRWRDDGVAFGSVSINAAAAEFRSGDFAERLLERLATASVPTSCIRLEVTETVFLGRGAEFVERALKTLSAEGVEIALDDFGTGYASLSHLKQFPVDHIKIDRSFVRDLLDDPDDAAIVDAVINLGRSLGIGIVAEGIETAEQHKMLSSLGCDCGQGFYYGRAAPAARVPDLLQPRRRRAA